MKLLKTSFLSALASLFKMTSGFVITKVIAIYGGPQGLAYVGQLQNFINLVLLGSGNMLKTAVIKLTAENIDNESELYKIWSNALSVALILIFLSCIPIFLFSGDISGFLFDGDRSFSFVIVAFAISVPAFLLNAFILSVVNGFQKIELLTKINIASTILSFIFVLFFSYNYGTSGALFSLATNQSVTIVFSFWFVSKHSEIKFREIKLLYDYNIVKEFFLYGTISIFSVTTANLSIYIVRSQVIDALSIDAAGIWQGAWSLVQALLTLLSMTMSVYFIPKIARAKNRAEINNETRKVILFILPVVIAISFIVYFFREFIITILFSDDFLSGEVLFLFLMASLPIKAIAWVYGYLLVINKRVKSVILSESISAFIFCTSNFILLSIYGLQGVSYAFFITSITHLLLVRLLASNEK
ncbi:O-antigen translocase [Vibrio splendidus]